MTDRGGRYARPDVASVPGGAHWGGSLWISTLDHALFGTLYQRGGRWGERQILPPEWLALSLTPCPLNPGYGFLWWPNHHHALSDHADDGAFAARGAGGNVVFVWRDYVTVLRWCADPKRAIDLLLDCRT